MRRLAPLHHRLPDPFADERVWREARAAEVPSAFAAAAWPSANLAIYVPVIFPASATLYSISFRGNDATGNYDLGFYDDAFNRIASSGAVAMSAATKTLALSEIRIKAGRLYYGALSLSSTGSVFRWTVGSTTELVRLNIANEAGAHPLPTTGAPASPSQTYVPILIYGVR